MADWSGLGADFWIRIGATGVLYVVLGAFMLQAKPRRRASAVAGAAVLLTGLSIIVRNIEASVFGSGSDPTFANQALGFVAGTAAVVALLLTILWFPAPLPRQSWTAIAAPAALFAAFRFGLYAIRQDVTPFQTGPLAIVGQAFWWLGAVMLLATAERLRLGQPKPFALAALALVLGFIQDAAQGTRILLDVWLAFRLSPLDLWVFNGLTTLAASLWLLRAAPGPNGRIAVRLMFIFLAAGLFGMLTSKSFAPELPDAVWNVGLGLIRLAAAGALAFAIFRRDLLGVPLPRARAHAGALASLFLIVLFALSQILQNFLNDSLGLVLGGIIAGVVVFSAGPLERRFSRIAHSDKARHEDAYRQTVRLALRDGRIKPDEERDLIIVAGKLGILPERAYIIRDEEEQALHGPRGRKRAQKAH